MKPVIPMVWSMAEKRLGCVAGEPKTASTSGWMVVVLDWAPLPFSLRVFFCMN